ncbi:MAG: hypothetical protein ACR2NT_02985 [Acidimicrobiia bacterium]
MASPRSEPKSTVAYLDATGTGSLASNATGQPGGSRQSPGHMYCQAAQSHDVETNSRHQDDTARERIFGPAGVRLDHVDLSTSLRRRSPFPFFSSQHRLRQWYLVQSVPPKRNTP